MSNYPKDMFHIHILLQFSDPDGIPTHNLLIRSQLLYAVELQDH